MLIVNPYCLFSVWKFCIKLAASLFVNKVFCTKKENLLFLFDKSSVCGPNKYYILFKRKIHVSCRGLYVYSIVKRMILCSSKIHSFYPQHCTVKLICAIQSELFGHFKATKAPLCNPRHESHFTNSFLVDFAKD